MVCRDGSLVHRQGIADGAPDAVQVSDRFHLWQGLSKRIGDIAAAHRGCLPAAVPEPEAASPPTSPAGASDQADTPAHRHAKRLFEAVHAVTDTGRSLNSAARESGLNRRTVGKYARAATWQECVRRIPPRRPTNPDPYLEYLRQRWEEGEHTATVLHQEISAKGYRGHYQRVKMAIAPLRRGLPIDTPRERPPSPRQVTRWITTAPSRHDLHTTEALRRLLDHCPELARTHDLVHQFAAMLDTRDARPLPLDHGRTRRCPAPPPPSHPHGRTPTPLPVTGRHRRTVAHTGFTEILPGPRSLVRRHSRPCTRERTYGDPLLFAPVPLDAVGPAGPPGRGRLRRAHDLLRERSGGGWGHGVHRPAVRVLRSWNNSRPRG